MPTVIFVATTPFAVNAFLANHIAALSGQYRVVLCTNLDLYELSPALFRHADIYNIPFARKISVGIDLKTLFQLVTVIRKVDPAVIHSITPKAGLLAMLAGVFMGVPNRWHTFTGQLWANRKGVARRLLRTLDRLIALLASRVFADSTSQCRFLSGEGVVLADEICVLGSGSIAGVDLKRFHPDLACRKQLRLQIGTNADVCVFLFVGRLTKDKGVFDLIKAFRGLASKVRFIELWVVGPDEDALLKVLKEASAECPAPIRWFGATPTPEKFMVAADVLLLPSYREGFGSVIIEGAACGIPTIAYRIDGVIDAVVEGEGGLLVEVGQPLVFASAMQRLVFNKARRLRLGRQALERVVRDFSSEKITKAWLEFYRSQLGR